MKRGLQSWRLAALLVVALTTSTVHAQTFAYYPDDNVAPNYSAPAGWYPMFTNTTGCRIQVLIPASAFTGVTSLASIGFFVGNTTPAATNVTYSNFQVRIGPAGSPSLTATFATNLVPGTETLVVSAAGNTYTPMPAGAWLDFPFLNPIPAPTTAIIVDMQSQIPTGGAYFASSVSSTFPRCVAATYTGQATGTLGTSSGPKVRFGTNPENIFVAQTTGGGAGDLALSLTAINPNAASGYLLLSADTTHPVGSGPAVGIYPDGLTFSSLQSPLLPGNPLHFVVGIPGVFPDASFFVPPGTLSFLAGQTWDSVIVLVDVGSTYVGRSGVQRLAW